MSLTLYVAGKPAEKLDIEEDNAANHKPVSPGVVDPDLHIFGLSQIKKGLSQWQRLCSVGGSSRTAILSFQ